MNIIQAQSVLRLGYYSNRPVYLLGMPGIGKSQSVYQVAESLSEEYGEDVGVIEERTSTIQIDEIGDFKLPIDGKVKRIPQGWIPTAESVAAGEFPSRGFLFLDEIVDGTMSAQSAFQQLVLDRRLGSAKLAEGWLPVAASNRRSDRAAAGRLSKALSSRFLMVEVEPDLEVTVAHGLRKKWDAMILAWLRWVPDMLNTFDPKSPEPSFACPRSIEDMSKIISCSYFDTMPKDLQAEVLKGKIGTQAMLSFVSFKALFSKIPDLTEIRLRPNDVPIPHEPAIRFALLGAFLRNINEQSFNDYWPYVRRMEPELATVFVKDAQTANSDVTRTKAYTDFCNKYGNLIL